MSMAGSEKDQIWARYGGGLLKGGDDKDNIQIGYFEKGEVEVDSDGKSLYTPGNFVSGAGTDTNWQIEGGAGDDTIATALGDDTVKGGSGNDRISTGGGDDVLWGNTGNDRLSGGGGKDTYIYENDYGEDRFSDADGESAIDFSRVTAGITATISKRSVGIVDKGTGQELRMSGATIADITLTAATDTVYATSFPEWKIDVRDIGGADDYYFRTGSARCRRRRGNY